MIGDGMGPAYMKAYRHYQDNHQTKIIEKTTFDSFLVGSIGTDPKEKNQEHGRITDSAASAGAYATGQKMICRTLSIGSNNTPLLTVLERSKQLGMSTGLVVTTSLTDATPAAFATHHKSRYEQNAIADQFLDNRWKNKPWVDILFGGGTHFFIRKDRNLVKDFQSLGYHYVKNKKALLANQSPQMIGLFAPNQLKKAIDRDSQTPSLSEMTQVALNQLSKNKHGFFLLVEGSQIDWAGHRNDIVGVISEMKDFEQAFKTVLTFAKNNAHTQVILTADHSTGGLTVGDEVNGKKSLRWNAFPIKGFTKTPEEIVRLAFLSGDLLFELEKASTITLSKEEKKRLNDASKTYLSHTKKEKTKSSNKKSNPLIKILTDIINLRTHTGWTTHGHTGEDVYLYAYGPYSHELFGYSDNTHIGRSIFKWLNKKK
jgi:alkaline phosphatase